MNLGVVVIGRNEGERLARCLGSLAGSGAAVVYVDSGSTDGSIDLARRHGADVMELDRSIAFSASRAHNTGFRRLQQIAPDASLTQFVDGDCQFTDGWLTQAAEYLTQHPDVAIACGRLREWNAQGSIYNRLCDMEWDRPPGQTDACGGIFMIRTQVFIGVGGFNEALTSGEEPELCARIRQSGWAIFRLDLDMARHDAAMTRFGHWWRREVRNGYGALNVTRTFAHVRQQGLFVRDVRSVWAWTFGWLAALAVAAGVSGALGGPAAAGLAGAAALLLPPLQAARLAWRRRGHGMRVALAYGALTVVSKWAQLAGQLRWRRDRWRGLGARLIEYKAPAPPLTHE